MIFDANGAVRLTDASIARGMRSYVQVGAGTAGEGWFSAGLVNGTALTSGALAVDTLFAQPFYNGPTTTLDRIAFLVTTGGAAGSVSRCGIYANVPIVLGAPTSTVQVTPQTLVVDGGEFDTTTTGIKSTVISTTLTANTLYWFVFLCGVAAPSSRLTVLASGGAGLGYPSTLAAGSRSPVNITLAYAALPTYLSEGTGANWATRPVIFARRSA